MTAIDTLPLRQLRRIKARLLSTWLVHLVAVFSQQKSDELLLVYLSRDTIPNSLPASCKAISLDMFLSWDLEAYDGLVIAYSSISLLRADVPTKGYFFCSLATLLREQGLWMEFRVVEEGLSRFLLRRLEASNAETFYQEQAISHIVSLYTAALLRDVPTTNLVAVIPNRDLRRYVEMGDCTLVYRHVPDGLVLPPPYRVQQLEGVRIAPEMAPDGRAVVFEEVWDPALRMKNKHFPIELRVIIRKSSNNERWLTTLEALAQDFYEAWYHSPQQREYLTTAYALITECHLAQADNTDLVAVIPCQDWEQFKEHGTGLYLYRRLNELEGTANSTICRLLFSKLEDIPDLTASYGPLVFGIGPLSQYFESQGLEWQDLGPLLCRIEQNFPFARTTWLFVHDMAYPPEQEDETYCSRSILIESLTRCCTVLSLEDPWAWRQGRQPYFLYHAYLTLVQLLERQIRATTGAERLHFEVLKLWYSCAILPEAEIEPALHRIVELMGRYDVTSYVYGLDLSTLSTILVAMLSGGGQLQVLQEHYPDKFELTPNRVRQLLRIAAEQAQPTEVPSPLFREGFRRYTTITEQIQDIHRSPYPLEDKIKRLRACQEQLKRAQRTIFTRYHGVRVLNLLYRRAIEQTEEQLLGLQGRVSLVVWLDTHTVAKHEASVLTIRVRNVGRVSAQQVYVDLTPSTHFHVLDESSRQYLRQINTDEEYRIHFKIAPHVEHSFWIKLEVSHQDVQEGASQQYSFLVQVISLDRGNFQTKTNPYVYGPPIREHRFFYGRRRELESLLTHFGGGRRQNILLRGARRSGKTSILNMIKKAVCDRGGEHLIRAWFDVPEEMYPMLERLKPIMLDLQSIEHPGKVLTPSIFYHFVLDALREAGLESPLLLRILDEPVITNARFIRALQATLKKHRHVRLLCLVDEFDLVEEIEDRRTFYAHLRHVLSNVDRMTWVIASTLGLYQEVRDFESPLFNAFKIVEIGCLEREAACRLVLDPWVPRDIEEAGGAHKLQFMDDAVDAILHEAGRSPYFIQLLCSAVVDRANTLRTNYVLHQTVYEVVARVTASRRAAYEHFAYFWEYASGIGRIMLLILQQHVEGLTKGDLYRVLLAHVQEALPALSLLWLEQAYEQSLHRMEAVDAIRLNRNYRFVFGIPLFHRILTRRLKHEALWSITWQKLKEELGSEKNDG